MNHEQAFLQAIREHPDDDAPRLIYADWLEEQGGAVRAARASLIRIQCRLAELPEDDPARDALEDEEADLLAEYEAEWTQPLQEIAEDWRFSRGFVEHVCMNSDQLIAHAEHLFEITLLRSVQLRVPRKDFPRVVACPQLRWVETLSFRGSQLNDRALQQLLVSPHWERLTALVLNRNAINAPGVRALVQSSLFPKLRLLDLSWNQGIGNTTARLLAQTDRANRLQVLNMNETNLSAEGLRQLFETPNLPHLVKLEASRMTPHWNPDVAPYRGLSPLKLPAQLRCLNLSNSHLPAIPDLFDSVLPNLRSLNLRGVNAIEQQIESLLSSPSLSSLTSLDLGHINLGSAGARLLADSPYLVSLRHLDLCSNNIRDVGAKALVESPHLRSLRELALAGNGIGGPGLKALAASANLDQLRMLDLGANFIGGDTVRLLAESPHLCNLAQLDLSDAYLEEESARALASSANLARLRTLHLKKNLLGDGGARALAQSPRLSRLTKLDLNDNRIGKAGAEALAAASWRRMRSLDLRGNVFTDTQEALLRNRFGKAIQL
ncbi:MAG TPA: TIGR02996 domain-containing protein [Gemmataceae bacterium]|nr:TIGR02996 domain-containing protein [Gemmataceae bacterium]